MAEDPQVPAIPLSLVHAGETVKVTKVTGHSDLARRLEELGFLAGAEVEVMSTSGANMIVKILGTRFGIDVKAAQHVMTVPASDEA